MSLAIAADWVEASLMFGQEDRVSRSDVTDILTEDNIYTSQDLADEFVQSIWSEIQRRQDWISDNPVLARSGKRLARSGAWREHPPYAFLLFLSLKIAYPEETLEEKPDYTVQGELFERLTAESLQTQLEDWQVHRTGWSSNFTSKLAEVVHEVSDRLSEATGQLHPWSSTAAKEAGLDILLYRPYRDQRVGIPVYLMQCASGVRWKQKRHTPDLELWTKVITFAVRPKRAFAIPHALLDDEFKNTCSAVNGLVLDRCRLLAAADRLEQWVSDGLRNDLIEWLEPRVARLPYASE